MKKHLVLLVLVALCAACGGGGGGGSSSGLTPPPVINPGPPPTNSPLAVRLETIQQGTVSRDVYTAELWKLSRLVPGGVELRWQAQYGDIVDLAIVATYPPLDNTHSFNAEIALNIGWYEYLPAANSSTLVKPDCRTPGYETNPVFENRNVNLGFYQLYGTVCESLGNGSIAPRNADGTYPVATLRLHGINPSQLQAAELIFLPYKRS